MKNRSLSYFAQIHIGDKWENWYLELEFPDSEVCMLNY